MGRSYMLLPPVKQEIQAPNFKHALCQGNGDFQGSGSHCGLLNHGWFGVIPSKESCTTQAGKQKPVQVFLTDKILFRDFVTKLLEELKKEKV